MSLFELGPNAIVPIKETTFAMSGLRERRDLQRLLRSHIEVISPETLVIAEEFGSWDDSSRRIDLLGLDRDANLVVIELKRTEDGGHMDLQAIRYAAMVANMTFEQAVAVHGGFLRQLGDPKDASEAILEFLDWDEPKEDEFARDVRIVLASAEFSKEITTAVLWLNERDLDIRCIRVRPYLLEQHLVLDVQQIVPLPEAKGYQIQVKEKKERERESRGKRDFTKYDVALDGTWQERLPKRIAIFEVVRHLCKKGIAPEQISNTIPWRKSLFCRSEGQLSPSEFVRMNDAKVNSWGSSRYFCAEGELIYNGGNTYAFTSQWGNRTFAAIQGLIAAYPESRIECRVTTDGAT